MVNLKKSLGLSGDVVSGMTLGETAISGLIAGAVSGFESGIIPQGIPTPVTAFGNVAVGLALKGMVKGNVGNVIGNAFTMTGAVTLGQWVASFVTGALGMGKENTAIADSGESSPILF